MPEFQQQWSEQETAGLLRFGCQRGYLKEERDSAPSAEAGQNPHHSQLGSRVRAEARRVWVKEVKEVSQACSQVSGRPL